MNVIEFFRQFDYPKMSNSQKWRVIEQGALEINGDKWKPKEEMPAIITSVVIYPKGNRITLW